MTNKNSNPENSNGGGGGYNLNIVRQADVGMLSNPNILINGDFRNPVNQRGQSNYTGGGSIIDMWQAVSGDIREIVIEGGYLRIVGEASKPVLIRQYLEQYLYLIGQQATLSVATTDNKIYFSTGVLQDVGGAQMLNNVGDFKFYLNKVQDKFNFCIEANPGAGNVDIVAAKLEVGPISTLAHDLNRPSDYTETLAKCQRYLYVVGVNELSGSPLITCSREGESIITVHLPVPMRIVPTMMYLTNTPTIDARGKGHARTLSFETHNAILTDCTNKLIKIMFSGLDGDFTSNSTDFVVHGNKFPIVFNAEL